MAFAIFWFSLVIFFPMGYNSMSFYQDFQVNVYLWILFGMLYKLPQLALSAQFALESGAARSGSPAVFRPKDSWVPTR